MSNESKRCKVHYTGTFNDGTKFDSSYDRGEPLEFVCGAGMMIKGFDEAVKNMNIGEIIDIHLMPEEAYGMPDPANIITVAFEDMPGSENLEIGNQVYLTTPYGQQFGGRCIKGCSNYRGNRDSVSFLCGRGLHRGSEAAAD